MYIVYMALHINNFEVEQEVRTLARERGQTMTEVIGIAVKELRVNPKPIANKPTVNDLLKLLKSFSAGPINYDRTDDEILGYGSKGYSE